VEESKLDSSTVSGKPPAIVEGNPINNEDTLMVPKNDESLKQMIMNTPIDNHLVHFREQLMKDMEDMMRKMINETTQYVVSDRVQKAIAEKGESTIDDLFQANKSVLVEKIGATIKAVQDKAVMDLVAKSQVVLKNIAIKRDEVLEAINEDADQAIEDFLGATEYEKKNH